MGFFRGVGVVHVLVIGTTINISTRVLLAGVMTRRYGLAGLAAATGIGWMGVVGYQCWNRAKLKQEGRRVFKDNGRWR